jgi:hypothetical protein
MNSPKTTPHDYSGDFSSAAPLLLAKSVVGNDEERNWRSTKAAESLAADEVDELAEHTAASLQWGFFPRQLRFSSRTPW